jgi:hypothetical protein
MALKLLPRQKQRKYVYAMCTQLHNSGPNSSLHYHIAELARPELLRMARFIAEKNYQKFEAQEAVWSLSDDRPIPAIGDGKSDIANDLQQEAAGIKGLDLKKLKEEYKVNSSMIMADFVGSKVDRNIPFEIKDSAIVSVGFYDAEGKLIKPIVTDVLVREGKHSFRYDPYPLALDGKRYTVRMMKDGALYRQYYF